MIELVCLFLDVLDLLLFLTDHSSEGLFGATGALHLHLLDQVPILRSHLLDNVDALLYDEFILFGDF